MRSAKRGNNASPFTLRTSPWFTAQLRGSRHNDRGRLAPRAVVGRLRRVGAHPVPDPCPAHLPHQRRLARPASAHMMPVGLHRRVGGATLELVSVPAENRIPLRVRFAGIVARRQREVLHLAEFADGCRGALDGKAHRHGHVRRHVGRALHRVPVLRDRQFQRRAGGFLDHGLFPGRLAGLIGTAQRRVETVVHRLVGHRARRECGKRRRLGQLVHVILRVLFQTRVGLALQFMLYD